MCLKLPIVPSPIYSAEAVYYNILSLSKGLVAVLEIAPEIPPVNKWPRFTVTFFLDLLSVVF
jgi:hypothetical protein